MMTPTLGVILAGRDVTFLSDSRPELRQIEMGFDLLLSSGRQVGSRSRERTLARAESEAGATKVTVDLCS